MDLVIFLIVACACKLRFWNSCRHARFSNRFALYVQILLHVKCCLLNRFHVLWDADWIKYGNFNHLSTFCWIS
jgi:hypothetical protein